MAAPATTTTTTTSGAWPPARAAGGPATLPGHSPRPLPPAPLTRARYPPDGDDIAPTASAAPCRPRSLPSCLRVRSEPRRAQQSPQDVRCGVGGSALGKLSSSARDASHGGEMVAVEREVVGTWWEAGWVF